MKLTFSQRPLPTTSREIRLRRRPTGLPAPEHFELATVPVCAPGPDEVLVRNRVFRVPPTIRMMIAEGAEDVEGVPFPALRPGDTLAEEAVGEVLSAPPSSGLTPGDLVMHHSGFREVAVLPVAECTRVEHPWPDSAMHLGHGWTAFAALTRAARIAPGDVVFVSSAAGAIGSMAAMIAKHLGARRVVGSTSSREKARVLRDELGYDAVVLRDAGTFEAQLHDAAPEGLDVVIDAVGGEQLAAALSAARHGARIVILGALSGQLAREGTGRTAPVTLDSFPILLRRLELRGYSADDDPDARGEHDRRFGEALRSGQLRFPHTRLRGIEQAPSALCDVAAGRYVGLVVLEP